jgi:signal transduction histidine kinase
LRTDSHAVERRIDAAGIFEKRSPARHGRHVVDSIVDATALVAGIAETTRILVGDKPVSVELITPDLPVMVETDSIMLRRIITNLVVNALRSAARGKITIVLQVIGSTPEIVVTDMDSDYRHQRPTDLDAATDRAGNTGSLVDVANVPGLNASRDLARLIGGAISARSVYGRGAMYTLTLPILAADRRRDLYAVE